MNKIMKRSIIFGLLILVAQPAYPVWGASTAARWSGSVFSGLYNGLKEHPWVTATLGAAALGAWCVYRTLPLLEKNPHVYRPTDFDWDFCQNPTSVGFNQLNDTLIDIDEKIKALGQQANLDESIQDKIEEAKVLIAQCKWGKVTIDSFRDDIKKLANIKKEIDVLLFKKVNQESAEPNLAFDESTQPSQQALPSAAPLAAEALIKKGRTKVNVQTLELLKSRALNSKSFTRDQEADLRGLFQAAQRVQEQTEQGEDATSALELIIKEIREIMAPKEVKADTKNSHARDKKDDKSCSFM